VAIGSTDYKVQIEIVYCMRGMVIQPYFLKHTGHEKLLQVKITGAEDIVSCGPVAKKRP
jgi:hypothetical protein